MRQAVPDTPRQLHFSDELTKKHDEAAADGTYRMRWLDRVRAFWIADFRESKNTTSTRLN
ncbi:MAG: hypothetical protein H0W86_04360 [Armatimonadetes bacterium]|nr:hypothetical protein [Armatimonadota bacterium]